MGAAIDLNFKKSYNLPVGIIFSYNITSQPDFVYVANTYAHSAKLIFSYTGSYDFNLSLGYEYHWMKLLDIRDQANVRMVSFSTYYYF